MVVGYIVDMTHFTPADIETYMWLAQRASSRSKAERLKVGAVLVNPNRIMAFGYNGTPSGWDNCCEIAHEDGSLITKPETIHAELNALFKFVTEGISTKGCSLFLTHSPCLPCAQSLFLSQLHQVYYHEDYRSDAGVHFLRKAGINVTKVDIDQL